jgi:acetolactate synthase I/II/III large subunit
MFQTQERGTEAWWTETGAEEWADAIVAAMKLGGVEHLFFVSGSELTFYQEAIAKAHAMVQLAELLAIPVMESSNADRLNFPMTHWAYGTGPAAKDADVLLVMEDVVPFTPGPGSPNADAKIA